MAIVANRFPRNASGTTQSPGRVRPRILHVATRYLRGGSERRLCDVVRSLPQADHHVALGGDSDVALALKEVSPARLTVVPTLVRQPDPWRDLATLRRLVRIIGKDRYDLVVTHQSKAGVIGRVAARIRSVPVVHSLSMASFGPGYPRWQSETFRMIEARLVSSTAAYVVVGSDLARRYADIGAPPERLHVVRSGVPLPQPLDGATAEDDPRRRLGLPLDRPLVLYLGSLEARKNVLDLPRFLGRVVSMAAPVRPYLVVAGEGPQSDLLERAIAVAGLAGDAKLVGFVREPEPLVRAADVVILLSSAEGVPQVLVQAAAAGTPFVAYAVDGVRELIDLGADGAAVPLGDVAAAASATRSFLRRGRIARGASIQLTSWSPEVIAAEYRRVIGGVLESRSTGPRSFSTDAGSATR